MHVSKIGLLAVLTCCLPATALAEVDFYKDVFPALKANCVACHNARKAEASLNLETPEAIRTGGDTGPGVVPGKAGESLVLLSARHEGDYIMPPAKNSVGAVALKPAELDLLAAWINEGARDSVRQVEKIHWRTLPSTIHPMYAVAMTGDARWVAAGRGNLVCVYDLVTGTHSANLVDDTISSESEGARSHLGVINSVAFSPDGTRIATGGFRDVKIWRQNLPSSIRSKDIPRGDAQATAITPDGRQLLAITANGELRCVDVSTGEQLRLMPAVSTAAVQAIAISADSQRIAIATADNVIDVLNIESGEVVGKIPSPAPVQVIAWTAAGDELVSAAEGQPLRVWKLPVAGEAVAAPREIATTLPKVLELTPLSEPNRILTLGEEGQITIATLEDGVQVAAFAIPGARTLAVSPDNTLLVAGCEDGVVRTWDLAAGAVQREFTETPQSRKDLALVNLDVEKQALELVYYQSEINRLGASDAAADEVTKKANETVAAVSEVIPAKQTAFDEAAKAKAAAQAELDRITAEISALAEGADVAALREQETAAKAALMKVSGDELTAMKELRTPQNHLSDANDDLERSIQIKAKNAALLASTNEAITATTKTSEEAKAKLAGLKEAQSAEAKSRPVAVAFSRDGKTIAAVLENGIQTVWGVANGFPILRESGFGETTSANLVSVSPSQFVTVAPEGAVGTLNIGSNWVVERVIGGESAPDAIIDRVNTLQFTHDGEKLVTGGGVPSRSGEVKLWDVASGQLLADWSDRHTDSVQALQISSDGKLLATTGADRLVRVTDVATGQLTNSFEGHTHHVMGVSFRGDSRIIASAGADGSILIWDLQSGEQLRKISHFNKEATSSMFLGATANFGASGQDGRVLIVNDQGGHVRTLPNGTPFLYTVAASADGTVLASGGEAGILHVWNTTDGAVLATFEPGK